MGEETAIVPNQWISCSSKQAHTDRTGGARARRRSGRTERSTSVYHPPGSRLSGSVRLVHGGWRVSEINAERARLVRGSKLDAGRRSPLGSAAWATSRYWTAHARPASLSHSPVSRVGADLGLVRDREDSKHSGSVSPLCTWPSRTASARRAARASRTPTPTATMTGSLSTQPTGECAARALPRHRAASPARVTCVTPRRDQSASPCDQSVSGARSPSSSRRTRSSTRRRFSRRSRRSQDRSTPAPLEQASTRHCSATAPTTAAASARATGDGGDFDC
mmetsp:Transcript_36843/g.86063  ORF Transcript_36843/g.86063 Transcript_36843/m.86063 type:complete len:278 (+) Transcript_36843:291-1124(+)